MTTLQAIQPAMASRATAQPAAPMPQPADLPWAQDFAEPPAAAITASPRPATRRGRAAPAFAAVHWSVTALTVATALSILAGSYGGESSKPRELLPIMITAYP
jgi:hypothetical protein